GSALGVGPRAQVARERVSRGDATRWFRASRSGLGTCIVDAWLRDVTTSAALPLRSRDGLRGTRSHGNPPQVPGPATWRLFTVGVEGNVLDSHDPIRVRGDMCEEVLVPVITQDEGAVLADAAELQRVFQHL